MPRIKTSDLAALLEDMRRSLEALSERVSKLEPKPAPPARPVAARPQVTEEEVAAISAAVAAYLGVRVHIRQIRLLGSARWAQEGRVSIQASHRLHS